MNPKLVSRNFCYHGKIFDISQDIVQLPSGINLEIDLIHHNGGAAVLPLLDNGDVLLIKQYRHSAEEILLEIPAGRLEKGEDPRTAAMRELKEETGWQAKKFESITQFYALPGYSCEVIYCFLATELFPGEPSFDEDEEIQLIQIPFSKALNMAKHGEIKDAKTMIALLLAAEKALVKNLRFID